MNKWSPERAEAIRQFIDEYFMENRKSPTVRDIVAGTGISKTSVQRYLTDMKDHGEIEYNGRRSIGTNLSRNMFEHRRRFIDTFVNRIFLYDDKMVITFNYNKGTKTITFAELEASGILSISNIAFTGEPKEITFQV